MKSSYIRWGIVLLLLAMSVLTMAERSASSILLYLMQREFNFTTLQIGQIITLIEFISLVAAVVGGWWVDRMGARWGMTLSLAICSLANLATATVNSALGLGAARSLLAAGAPANYIAATKAMSEHISAEGRATALAVYSLASKIAPLLAPPILLMTADRWGWRFASVAIGILGVLLLLLWLWRYRSPRADTAEPMPIETESAPVILSVFAAQEATQEKSFWRSPTIWLLLASNALTGQMGTLLTGWMGTPSDAQTRAWQRLPILLFTLVGILGSGIISDYRIRAGQHPVASRMQMILVATGLMMFCWVLPLASSSWVSIVLLALIALGNASWMLMMTALLLDVTPTRSVGLVMGIVVASSGWLSGLVMSGAKLFWAEDDSVVTLLAISGLQLLAFWLIRRATRPPMSEAIA